MSEVSASPPARPAGPKGRWRSLVAMAFALTIDNNESGLVNSLYPVIRQALVLSISGLGVFSSISKFARMIFGPLWAIAADKYGRKKVLIFITGIWGIWTAVAGLAQNYTQLIILYALGAIGTVASEPIANALLSDMFGSDERGKAYGTIRAVSMTGGVLLTPLIGRLSNVEGGWRIGLFIMGGMSVVSGIIIAAFVKEPRRGASETAAATHDAAKERFELAKVLPLLKTRTILLMIPSQVLLTSLLVFSFAVTYLVDVRHFTNARATVIYSVAGLGWIVSSLTGGHLGDWFERRYPSVGRIVLMQLYLVSFAVMSLLTMQVAWSSDVGYFVSWFFWGMVGSWGFSGAVLPMISAVTLPEIRSTAFSLLQALLQGLQAAIVSLLVGFLAERYGLAPVMFWFVTVPYGLNAVYWFTFYKVYPRDVTALEKSLAERSTSTAAG